MPSVEVQLRLPPQPRLDQAALERRTGELERAAGSLARVRDALNNPGDASVRHWRQVSLGLFVAEEHYALSGALADAGVPAKARVLLAAAEEIRGGLSQAAARGVRELAEATAEKVRAVS